jgi:hypothetical protein
MPERGFPETFLEIGKDDDHSYMSLRTTRLPDGRLKIDVEKWRIIEIGFFLEVETSEIVELRLKGYCGTVPRRTWAKSSFSHVLEAEQEDKARYIEFHGYVEVKVPAERDILKVGEIEVLLRLLKFPMPYPS